MGLAQNDDEDEEDTPTPQDDQEEGDDSGDEPAEPAEPGADKPAEPAEPGADKQQAIKDYLAKQYGAAADNSGVAAARSRASTADTIASFGNALETIARARSQALGGPGANSAYWNGMRQNANAGVDQAQADRSAKIQDFLQKNQLGRQVAGDTMKAAEFDHKQDQWDLESDQHDPESDVSAGIRATYKKMFPDVVAKLGDDFDNLSAADIKANLASPLELKAKMDANKEIAASRNQARADAVAARKEAADANAATRKETADAAKSAKADKADEDTARKMGDDLDPSKGRNGALGVATQKIANAQALSALAKGQGENLDSRQMEELAIGMNRLISGSNAGAASQVKALVPETAWGSASKMKEWLMNEPTGTNQQAFAQRMMETVGREADTARKQIETYQRGKLGKYESMKKRNPDMYDAVLKPYEDNYGVNLHPDREAAPAAAISAAPTDTSTGTAQAAGEEPAAVRMQAPDGSIRFVPKDSVMKYQKKGAKVVP